MYENTFLQIGVEDINNMTPRALQSFAERQSEEILNKLEESVQKIRKYQEGSIDDADLDVLEHVRNFISGGTYKRDKDHKALRNSVERMRAESGEAMLGMVALIQESVKFTCSSVKLAQCMQSSMAVMMAKGFKDSNGNIHELNGNTKKFAEYILNQADIFVSNQSEFDQRIKDLEQFKTDIEAVEREQDFRIDKALDGTEKNLVKIENLSDRNKVYDEAITAGEKKDAEQDNRLRKQAEKDIEHDRAIVAGIERDVEQDKQIKSQAEKDIEHDKAIAAGEKKDAEQDNRLIQVEKRLKEIVESVSSFKEEYIRLEKTVLVLERKRKREIWKKR